MLQDRGRVYSTETTGYNRILPFLGISCDMSTDIDDPGDEEFTPPVTISLSFGESGDVGVARDEDTGVTSQGQTREAARKPRWGRRRLSRCRRIAKRLGTP